MVQVGVWELPMVLGEDLLINGMSALLLILWLYLWLPPGNMS